MKISELQALTAALNAAPEKPFAACDVVIWKDQALRTHNSPSLNQPVVVSRILAVPVQSTEDDDQSHGFGRPFNLVIAAPALSMEGTIGVVEFHMDSRNFRHATQEEIKAWDALPVSEKFPTNSKCNCAKCTLKKMLEGAIAAQEPTQAPSPDKSVTH